MLSIQKLLFTQKDLSCKGSRDGTVVKVLNVAQVLCMQVEFICSCLVAGFFHFIFPPFTKTSLSKLYFNLDHRESVWKPAKTDTTSSLNIQAFSQDLKSGPFRFAIGPRVSLQALNSHSSSNLFSASFFHFCHRYLISHGRFILTTRELDAFLAQALSPHLTTECNASNLREIKLKRVDARAVQLASLFMRGVQAAIFANDACAVPIPWELVCPWNYFDGKLFHSKYLMVADNVSLLELCDGKVKNIIISLYSHSCTSWMKLGW